MKTKNCFAGDVNNIGIVPREVSYALGSISTTANEAVGAVLEDANIIDIVRCITYEAVLRAGVAPTEANDVGQTVGRAFRVLYNTLHRANGLGVYVASTAAVPVNITLCAAGAVFGQVYGAVDASARHEGATAQEATDAALKALWAISAVYRGVYLAACLVGTPAYEAGNVAINATIDASTAYLGIFDAVRRAGLTINEAVETAVAVVHAVNTFFRAVFRGIFAAFIGTRTVECKITGRAFSVNAVTEADDGAVCRSVQDGIRTVFHLAGGIIDDAVYTAERAEATIMNSYTELLRQMHDASHLVDVSTPAFTQSALRIACSISGNYRSFYVSILRGMVFAKFASDPNHQDA